MTDERQQDGEGDGTARTDLSPLDPTVDRARFQFLVHGVVAAAAGELARRRAAPSVWELISRWRRPVLVGSGLLAAVAALVLMLTQPVTESNVTLAEAGGVPDVWVTWSRADRNPSPGELLTLDHGTRSVTGP